MSDTLTNNEKLTPQDVLQLWTQKNAQGVIKRNQALSCSSSPVSSPTTATSRAALKQQQQEQQPNTESLTRNDSRLVLEEAEDDEEEDEKTHKREHRRTLSNMSFGSLAGQPSEPHLASDSDSTGTETDPSLLSRSKRITSSSGKESGRGKMLHPPSPPAVGTSTMTMMMNRERPFALPPKSDSLSSLELPGSSFVATTTTATLASPTTASTTASASGAVGGGGLGLWTSSSIQAEPGIGYEWIKDLNAFKRSCGLRRTELKCWVRTRTEEAQLRAACAARGLIAQEAGRYNARLKLGHAGGLVHVVEDEVGRTDGEVSTSDVLTRPKMFRVARHRAAVLGPLIAPMKSIVVGSNDRALDALISTFVERWASAESEQVSVAREHAILVLRGIVREWVLEVSLAHEKARVGLPPLASTASGASSSAAAAGGPDDGSSRASSSSPSSSSSTSSAPDMDDDDRVDVEEAQQQEEEYDDSRMFPSSSSSSPRRIIPTDKMKHAVVAAQNKRKKKKKKKEQHPDGAVFLSGSACFGVADIDSDVDAVCLVPKMVARSTFFTTLLEKLRVHPSVSHVIAVASAQVPVIRLRVDGIPIDLLMARLAWAKTVSGDIDVLDDEILEDMDVASVTSLSGPRNADMIRGLVPNYSTFRTTLRFVRFWAKRRAVYSSKLGYLGGLSWAILVALIVQLFPTASPARCLYWFFEVFSRWDWSHTPVRLCDNGGDSWRRSTPNWQLTPSTLPVGPINAFTAAASSTTTSGIPPPSPERPSVQQQALLMPRLEGRVSSVASLASYQSASSRGSRGEVASEDTNPVIGLGLPSRSPHLMPIITPSAPASDTASSVTFSTMIALQMEWARGRSITRALFDSSKSVLEVTDELALYELFAPFSLAQERLEFVRIDLAADSEDAWTRWLAFVESRLRKLTTLLESVPCVERIRIDPECYATGQNQGSFYVGIEKNAAAKAALSVVPELAAHEQDEAILRTVLFFAATHLRNGRVEEKRFEVEILADCLASSSAASRMAKEDDDNNAYDVKCRVELFGARKRLELEGIIVPGGPVVESLGFTSSAPPVHHSRASSYSSYLSLNRPGSGPGGRRHRVRNKTRNSFGSLSNLSALSSTEEEEEVTIAKPSPSPGNESSSETPPEI